jgi:hypothetical protein
MHHSSHEGLRRERSRRIRYLSADCPLRATSRRKGRWAGWAYIGWASQGHRQEEFRGRGRAFHPVLDGWGFTIVTCQWPSRAPAQYQSPVCFSSLSENQKIATNSAPKQGLAGQASLVVEEPWLPLDHAVLIVRHTFRTKLGIWARRGCHARRPKTLASDRGRRGGSMMME